MIDHGNKNVLGILVNAIDYDAAVEKILTAAHNQSSFSVSALAVHGIMTGVADPVHRYRLNNLDLVVPDGQPVRWALNWLYHLDLFDRVYGPTLMLKLCERAGKEGLSIFLYGSEPMVIESLKRNLYTKFPNLEIAGVQPSEFRRVSRNDMLAIADKIHQSGAAITFVGLGCPRQEVWVYEYKKLLPMPLIAVGAAFDFHAGLLAQAPMGLQKSGLEWFYRLMKEPHRLWKRYILLNPQYLYLLLLQLLKIKQFDPSNVTIPDQEMRYS